MIFSFVFSIDASFASEPVAVSPSGKNVRGGLPLLAALTQGEIVPFRAGNSQELCALSHVGHRLTRIGGHSYQQGFLRCQPCNPQIIHTGEPTFKATLFGRFIL